MKNINVSQSRQPAGTPTRQRVTPQQVGNVFWAVLLLAATSFSIPQVIAAHKSNPDAIPGSSIGILAAVVVALIAFIVFLVVTWKSSAQSHPELPDQQ